jgi:site-specific DNA recombinase
VWRDACELLRHPQLLRKEYERRLAAPASSDGEQSLRKQVNNAQRTVNRLIDAYADGVVDRAEFEPRVARARKRLSDLEAKLDALQSETREQTALREALACLNSFADTIHANLDQADWTTRREILRTLIERVLIEPDQIRIVYRINFPLFAKKASKEKVLHFCWRSGDSALRRTDSRPPQLAAFHHSGLEELLHQPQNVAIRNLVGQLTHDGGVRQVVEETGNVGVEHVTIPLPSDLQDFLYRVMAASSFPETIRMIVKLRLEDRTQQTP